MAAKKKGSGVGAVIRFVEKVAMFVVAALACFALIRSDYPSRWLVEDSESAVFARKHRGCLLIEFSAPDEYHTIYRPTEKNSLRPDENSENCGFIDHEEDEWFSGRVSVFQVHGNVSSLLTNQYSFLGKAHASMGAESYEVNPGYLLLLGGVATALSVVFEGCLLIAKLVDVPKAWWFSLLSLIPYFFYIPLNIQVSENQQVWIRFPALYETAALLLIVAAAFLSVAACALACICASGEMLSMQGIIGCGMCGIMTGYGLLLLVLIALYTNFTFPASFDFDFDFDFSFSIYMEILKVLTWTAMGHPLPSPTAVTTIAIQPTLAILNALPLGPGFARGVHFPSWFRVLGFGLSISFL
ncbi:unnamed protein product [Symbiodinium microadriaticum]|nr:unnamed protein product [Symbiodinium microadriaticum]